LYGKALAKLFIHAKKVLYNDVMRVVTESYETMLQVKVTLMRSFPTSTV